MTEISTATTSPCFASIGLDRWFKDLGARYSVFSDCIPTNRSFLTRSRASSVRRVEKKVLPLEGGDPLIEIALIIRVFFYEKFFLDAAIMLGSTNSMVEINPSILEHGIECLNEKRIIFVMHIFIGTRTI